jgi:hypothetical protein
MRRYFAVASAVVLMSASVLADVTITSTGSGKGLGMSANMQTVTYIKGGKMRTDVTTGDQVIATITDLDAQKMILIYVKKKEAEVYDLTKMAGDVDKNVGTITPKVTFAPNGQKKDIAGKSCVGYDMNIELPMAAGKEGADDMKIVMSGPVWIARDVPGSKDFAGFYRAAIEKGFVFNNPQQAKAQPAQAKAFAEMYRSMIATGGMMYGQEMTMKFAGGGPMAGIMGRVGGMSMTTTVTDVKVESLPDDLFAVPAGFKSKVK